MKPRLHSPTCNTKYIYIHLPFKKKVSPPLNFKDKIGKGIFLTIFIQLPLSLIFKIQQILNHQ